MAQPAIASDAELSRGIADPLSSSSLDVDPFSDDLDIFFTGAERRAALDEVVHLCQFGNSLVAVLGEAGVGKSTLINEACRDLDDVAKCCVVDISELASIEDVLDQIVEQLDLELPMDSTAGEMLAGIRRFVPDDEFRRVIIVIDDAHYLDDKVLSALVSLLQGQQTYHLHVLLAGDHSLADRLDAFEMVDVLIYDVIIQPLRPEELGEYLSYRLEMAGYEGEVVFDAEAINSIWTKTRGIPGAVDEAARQFLVAESITEEKRPVTGLPLPHMMVMVALLAVLIMALLYMGEDGVVEEKPEVVIDASEQIPPTKSESQPPATMPKEEAAVAQAMPASPVSSSAGDPVSEKIDRAVKAVEAKQKSPSAQAKVAPKSDGSAKDPSTNKAAPANSGLASKTATTVDTSKQPGTKKPETSAEKASKEPSLADSLKQQLAAEYHSIEQGSDKVVQKSAKVAQPSPAKAKGLSSHEKEVLSWPGSDFTLQVVAAGSKSSVEAFIKAQPNRQALRLVTTLRNSKPWYVVVTGHYKDRNLARQALGSLPAGQVKSGAWPRTVASLQREIDAFRRF